MVALDDVTLELREGEILALVGENGAGKSSLMNVLYGLYQPDAGEIWIGDERVRLDGPRDAIRRGIGMVHQHFMLVPSLTVAENVVLGREPTRRGLLDFDAACAQVEQTCRRFGFKLDPRARIASLSVGSQQKVEIIKALHRGAQTLILDEPTAVLTPQEADELLQVVRALAAQHHGIVLISHRLREVLSIATRIAVMRRGQKVAEVSPETTSAGALAELMVGGAPHGQRQGLDVASGIETKPRSPSAAPAGPVPLGVPRQPLLTVEGLEARGEDGRPALRGVSLELHAGEIVGIAGVDGNGQRELAEVLTGLRRWDRGTVRLAGTSLEGTSPGVLRRLGVAHIPEDRLRRAIVGPMSVEENVALGRQHRPPFDRKGLIDFRGRREQATQLIRDYDVRPPDPLARMLGLSGGNQQKVVVARELDGAPRLLVVVQPTRGLDVAAVASVHARLRAVRERGCAVLLSSLDLDEVFALSDRVYVMFEGRVTGHLIGPSFDERVAGRMMLGAAA